MPYPALSTTLISVVTLLYAAPGMAQNNSSRPVVAAPGAPSPRVSHPATAAPRTPPPPMAKAAFLANVDKEFEAMDANKDKKLTKSEIEQFRVRQITTRRQQQNRALFAQLDTDKNGYLSAQEFERVAGPPPAINVQPLMDKMDANKDQQVTPSEYRAGASADFDRLDANKDGALSPAEARSNQPVRR